MAEASSSSESRGNTLLSYTSDWNCTQCTLQNAGRYKTCKMCKEPREPLTDWNCTLCTLQNGGRYKTCKVCKQPREPLTDEKDADDDLPEELRFVVLGKTGTGKSSLGNSILGEDLFEVKPSSKGVTQFSTRKRAFRHGRDVHVVDTPGLFDISTTAENLQKEILRCVAMSLPGPHAFLLVLTIGRFTPEDQATMDQFSKIFGDDFFRYAVVVFTGEDELDRSGMTVDDYLQGEDTAEELKALLKKCDNRYICINNWAPSEEKDARCQKLIKIVDDNQDDNGGKFFTNAVYLQQMEPFDNEAQATLGQCRKDRSLNRLDQKKRKDHYVEEIQICEAKMNSLDQDKSSMENDLLSKFKELSLKVESLDGELRRRKLKEDVLIKRVSKMENERVEQHRAIVSGDKNWVLEAITLYTPTIVNMVTIIWRLVLAFKK